MKDAPRENINQKKMLRSEGGAELLTDSYSQLAQDRDIYFFVLKLLFIIVCEQ